MTSSAYHFQFTPCTSPSGSNNKNDISCSIKSNSKEAVNHPNSKAALQNNDNTYVYSCDSNMSFEHLLNKWGLPAFDASTERGMALAHFTYAIHHDSSLNNHHRNHHNRNNNNTNDVKSTSQKKTCINNVEENSKWSEIVETDEEATNHISNVACESNKNCISSIDIPFHIGMADDFLTSFFSQPEVQMYFSCELPIQHKEQESKSNSNVFKHNTIISTMQENESSKVKEQNTLVKSALHIASVNFSVLSLKWHSFAPFKRLFDAGVLRSVHHASLEKRRMQEDEQEEWQLQQEESKRMMQTEQCDKQNAESTSNAHNSSKATRSTATTTATNVITRPDKVSKMSHNTNEHENWADNWCKELPVVKRMEKILADGSVITDELRALFLDTPMHFRYHPYLHDNNNYSEHIATSLQKHNNNNDITANHVNPELYKLQNEQSMKRDVREYSKSEEEDEDDEDDEDEDEYDNFSSFDYYHDNSKKKQLTRKERRAIFTTYDRNELLYHVVWHLVAGGGAFNQYDENFAIYIHAARQLFRRLVTSIHVSKVVTLVNECQTVSHCSTEKYNTVTTSNKSVRCIDSNNNNDDSTLHHQSEQQEHNTDEVNVKYEPHIDSFAFAIHRIHVEELNRNNNNNCSKPCSKVQRQASSSCTLFSYTNADKKISNLHLSNDLWPSNVNYCYVIVNPHERSVVLWEHHMK